MKLKFLIVVISLFSGLVSTSQADLLNFDFSFTDDLAPGGVNNPGVVTGELIGLADNATSLPTDILITSAPSGLDVAGTYDFAPLTLASGGITVTNDVVTAASASFNSRNNDYTLSLNAGTFGDNFLQHTGGNNFLSLNNLGFSGASYSPAATPEPNAMDLAAICIACFLYLRYGGRLALKWATPRR